MMLVSLYYNGYMQFDGVPECIDYIGIAGNCLYWLYTSLED